MALQHADNYTPYGIGQQALMLNGVYADVTACSLVADPDPNASAGSIALQTTNSNGITGARFILSGTRTKVGMAQRLWMPAIPSIDLREPFNNGAASESPLLQIRDISNNAIVSLGVRANAGLILTDGNPNVPSPIIAETAGPVVSANAWWHIELLCETIGLGSISYEVRVEGVTVMSGTGTVTNTNAFAQVLWGTKNFFGRLYYWKDAVCYDGTGSHNNSFLGSVTVVSIVPTSDELTGWTPSTGTSHYPLVDNSPPLDGTQYVTAPYPPPTPDQYGLSALPDDVTSVKGIMTFVRARKSDGGDGNLQVSMVSNGDTANGADRPITAAFTYWRDIFETDPDTGSSWLPGAVDAASIKINRTL